MFEGLTNLASLFRAAQTIGPKLAAIQQQLKAQRATGAAGGEMVVVEANGMGEIVRVTIEPSLVAKGDAEMIQDLTVAATNQALAKSRELHMEAMKSLTDGVDMPGLQDMLSRMGSGS